MDILRVKKAQMPTNSGGSNRRRKVTSQASVVDAEIVDISTAGADELTELD